MNADENRPILPARPAQRRLLLCPAKQQLWPSRWSGPRLFSVVPVFGPTWNPKSWTHLELRITVWCELTRRPVPLFRERKPVDARDPGAAPQWRGTETIMITREWVQALKKGLKWGGMATTVLGPAVPGLLGGLVTATGGIMEASDAEAFKAELAKQQKALKDLESLIPDEGNHPLRRAAGAVDDGGPNSFGREEFLGYGAPAESDLKLIRHLREEFKKKDPTWGGLAARPDAKFNLVWAHPLSPTPE